MKFRNPDALFSHYTSRYLYWDRYELDISHKSHLNIVIPSFQEEKLMETLRGLDECLPIEPKPTVIVVLNHPENSPEDLKKFHESQYEQLLIEKTSLKNIHVQCIKAFNLKPKEAGVGTARKIGMDQALRDFCRKAYNGLIICLDGDCLVDKSNLKVWESAEQEGIFTGIAPYKHQRDCGADLNRGIAYYELYLRMYKTALEWIGFPYAYDTIGSCMAVRASIYAKVGGMNRRKAGEDFYFLHKCFPLGRVKELKNGMVYPSCRISDRVPFGTGKAQADWIDREKYLRTYSFQSWAIIKSFLDSIKAYYYGDFTGIPRTLQAFLKSQCFYDKVKEIHERSNDYQTFDKHFYAWCDGFTIMKMLHFLRDHHCNEEALVKTAASIFHARTGTAIEESIPALSEAYFQLAYGDKREIFQELPPGR